MGFDIYYWGGYLLIGNHGYLGNLSDVNGGVTPLQGNHGYPRWLPIGNLYMQTSMYMVIYKGLYSRSLAPFYLVYGSLQEVPIQNACVDGMLQSSLARRVDCILQDNHRADYRLRPVNALNCLCQFIFTASDGSSVLRGPVKCPYSGRCYACDRLKNPTKPHSSVAM